MHKPLRLFWALVGGLALVLGALGVVLPVLPTTPFVILAAFAFGKSHPGAQAWLERNRLFGPMIRDWRARGAIAPRVKVLAVAMMALALGAGLWSNMPWVGKVVQVVVMALAAAYVVTRPSR